MSVVIQRESTEYIYLGSTGSPPSVGADVAILAQDVRPTAEDWNEGTIVDNESHPLWSDAVSSGVTGDYYVALLVGSFGGNPVAPGPGDYQVWLQLTDDPEQVVRIAPVALEVA